MLPVTWWANEPTSAGAAVALLMFVLAVVTFLRMGRGRWFRSSLGGVVKGLSLTILLFAAATIAMLPLFAIAYAGATYIS